MALYTDQAYCIVKTKPQKTDFMKFSKKAMVELDYANSRRDNFDIDYAILDHSADKVDLHISLLHITPNCKLPRKHKTQPHR